MKFNVFSHIRCTEVSTYSRERCHVARRWQMDQFSRTRCQPHAKHTSAVWWSKMIVRIRKPTRMGFYDRLSESGLWGEQEKVQIDVEIAYILGASVRPPPLPLPKDDQQASGRTNNLSRMHLNPRASPRTHHGTLRLVIDREPGPELIRRAQSQLRRDAKSTVRRRCHAKSDNEKCAPPRHPSPPPEGQ